MNKYVIGLDFGTNSCRALIVSLQKGKELASHVFSYPSGKDGVIIDSSDPNLARQNPKDYLLGIENTITESIKKAKQAISSFDVNDIIGIGVDTTGSSPLPVDENGTPLCFQKKYQENPNAMVWLWKDHTSFAEAELITRTAEKIRPQYLSKIGGIYSSEWFWSKILRCKNIDEEVFNSAYSFVEICDWIPAALTGILKPEKIKRSVCAAGHKAMFNETWNGLPDEEFLNTLSNGLGQLRQRLYDTAFTSEKKVGCLSKEWASKLGLSENVVISVGAFDAHMGAVGAGINEGTLVKIIGTSTCDVMIASNKKPLKDIPGVCGIVNGSVMNDYFGIEAGQSAVGDIFLWLVNNLTNEKYGLTQDEKFKNLESAANKLYPGETGLLALDWNNGNRTILVDVRLSGLLLGQTLYTEPHEIYRALIEATAFGALVIINRIEEFGVEIKEVINCGGLAVKNSLMMQIYADIIGRPMKISSSQQTPALGAAIFAAVAAGKNNGGYNSVLEAQNNMTGISKVYNPIPQNHEVYKKIFKLYHQLHNAFGTDKGAGNLYNVMKDLLEIRDEVKRSK
jgi:L-ribulokinase